MIQTLTEYIEPQLLEQIQGRFSLYRSKHKDSQLLCIILEMNIMQQDQGLKTFYELQHYKPFGLLPLLEVKANPPDCCFIYADLQADPFEPAKYTANVQIEMILQLCILFSELQTKRQIIWNNWDPSVFVIVEDRVLLRQYYYRIDESSTSPENALRSFQKLIRDKFQIGKIVGRFSDATSYREMIGLACEVLKINPSNPYKLPGEDLMLQILCFHKKKAIILEEHQFNCKIVQYETNSLVERFYPNLKADEIVIKSTKIITRNPASKQFHLINIQREIDCMEHFPFDNQLAGCFTYIRIEDQAFLMMPYYKYTLSSYLQMAKVTNDMMDKIVILTMAKQFSEALRILHSQKYVHRDLKPENIFMTSADVKHWDFRLLVADFDRSREFLENQQQDQKTMNNAFSPCYQAPDGQFSKPASDIWQFGYIMVEILNNGTRLFQNTGACYIPENEYNKKTSINYLIENCPNSKHFGEGQIRKQFMEMISKCLNRKPEMRPSTGDLANTMKRLYLNSKIKIVPFNNGNS